MEKCDHWMKDILSIIYQCQVMVTETWARAYLSFANLKSILSQRKLASFYQSFLILTDF